MDHQPWSVKGVEPEAREAAKLAARRAGLTVGAWLNRVIRTAAAEELSGRSTPQPAAPASDPPQLPALPIDALVEAMRKQMDEQLRAHLEAHADELLAAIRENSDRMEPAVERLDQLAVQLSQAGNLADRVAAAEAQAAKAQLAVGPLERTVVRLSERMSNTEEVRMADEPPTGGGRRGGLLSRIFGG